MNDDLPTNNEPMNDDLPTNNEPMNHDLPKNNEPMIDEQDDDALTSDESMIDVPIDDKVLSEKVNLETLLAFVKEKETIAELNKFINTGCGIPKDFSTNKSTRRTWKLFNKLIEGDDDEVNDLFDGLLQELLQIYPQMKNKHLNENLSIVHKLLELFNFAQD